MSFNILLKETQKKGPNYVYPDCPSTIIYLYYHGFINIYFNLLLFGTILPVE